MTPRIKLLLLIPHLGGGGAERIAAQLARSLDPNRFDIHITLITQDLPGSLPLPAYVTVHRFQSQRIRHAWWKLLRHIRSEQPEVVLSGMAHLNHLLLLLKPFVSKNTRILVRQDTTASASAVTPLSKLLYRYLYPRADQIICQSQAMADDFAHNFHLPRKRLTVLANPVDISAIRTASATLPRDCKWPPQSRPRLLAIGRLAHEKGIDLLLHALVIVKRHHPQLQLTVLGTGPAQAQLRELTHQLDLTLQVNFAGYSTNPTTWYSGATLFVLPSRYEGMPNALLEAAAAGLPVVATPCCAGVTNLLTDAPGAWLASAVTAPALADAILAALSTLKGSFHAQRRFDHPFLAPFERNTAIAAYEDLLLRVAGQDARQPVSS